MADALPRAGLPSRPRVLLALVSLATVLPMIPARDLWHADEPRYAQIAREILGTGDWLVMHLNDEVYTEKPPLYFWCEALLASFQDDVNAWHARLPSFVSGLVAVLLTFGIGRRLLPARTAFCGALVLATTFYWWWISQRCALDAMVALWVLLAIYSEERAREALRRSSPSAPGIARRWRLVFFVALGLGVLTKGPVVLLLGFLALVARAWAARDLRSLRQVPWLRGTLLLLAVIGMWFVPWGFRLGWDRVGAILSRQTAGRMSESFAHAQPPWYFAVTLPLNALPWTLAWVCFAWRAARRRSAQPHVAHVAHVAHVDGRVAAPVAVRFLVAWAAAAFILFSCFSGKRGLYLLPIYPALALLTAHGFSRLAPPGSDWVGKAIRGAGVLVVLFALGGSIALPVMNRGFELGSFDQAGRSPRPLGERVRAAVDAGDRVVLVDLRHPESALYFARLPRLDMFDFDNVIAPTDEKLAALRRLFATHQEHLLLVIDRKDAARVVAALAMPPPILLTKVDQLTVDDRDYELWRLAQEAPR